MNFDIFDRLTETTGYPCTRDVFYNITDGDKVARIWRQCQEAAAQGDKKRVDELKRQLPFITWQASFKDHRRSNANALPSGLFMLDVDKVENPDEFRENVIAPAIQNAATLGIVAIHLAQPAGVALRGEVPRGHDHHRGLPALADGAAGHHDVRRDVQGLRPWLVRRAPGGV